MCLLRYIDHVKDGKAYISQPKVGWVSEGNVVQVTQKDTGSFFQRVMQKISQSIHKDESKHDIPNIIFFA